MLDPVIPPQPNPATTTLPSTWWSAALTTQERRPDGTRPAWVDFAEAALSRESATPGAALSRESAGSAHWRAAFASVFRPFSDAARAAIAGAAAASPAVDATAVTNNCTARRGHQLAGRAARTLVLE